MATPLSGSSAMMSPHDSHHEKEDPFDIPSERIVPLPPGEYSVLPIVERCDNVELPKPSTSGSGGGDWSTKALKARLSAYRDSKISATVTSAGRIDESAVEDDDDDDEDEHKFDDEFLTPFFLSLPQSSGKDSVSASRSLSRRSSSGGSHRPSFSFTPVVASLRSSSPTPSHPDLPPHHTQGGIDQSTASSKPIGFLRPRIVEALLLDNAKMVQIGVRPAWSFLPPIEVPAKAPPQPLRRRSSAGSRRPSTNLSMTSQQQQQQSSQPGTPGGHGHELHNGDHHGGNGNGGDPLSMKDVLAELKRMDAGSATPYAVGFADWVNEEGSEARKEQMDRVTRAWKMKGDFADVLGGWRDELYSIYGPTKPIKEIKQEDMSPLPGSNVAFEMERAACALFGFATFGVHCTAYVERPDGSIAIWVPKRSSTKQTWPGMLDNSVAGGISAGTSARSAMIRECLEEASLEPDYTASRLKAAGLVSYTYRTEHGWLQPEVQYVYDLRVEEDVRLEKNDNEVESFELMSLDKVVKAMFENKFKPNCALVLVDFLIRHGWITSETDTRFVEVASRIRRTPVLPSPA